MYFYIFNLKIGFPRELLGDQFITVIKSQAQYNLQYRISVIKFYDKGVS